MCIEHEDTAVRDALRELAGALFDHAHQTGRTSLLLLLNEDGSELRLFVEPGGILELSRFLTARGALKAFRRRQRQYLNRQVNAAEQWIQEEPDNPKAALKGKGNRS